MTEQDFQDTMLALQDEITPIMQRYVEKSGGTLAMVVLVNELETVNAFTFHNYTGDTQEDIDYNLARHIWAFAEVNPIYEKRAVHMTNPNPHTSMFSRMQTDDDGDDIPPAAA